MLWGGGISVVDSIWCNDHKVYIVRQHLTNYLKLVDIWWPLAEVGDADDLDDLGVHGSLYDNCAQCDLQ